jgi:BirA family biotin operon repressor/biotin-[acetyl-CoA-carboxylase] ligase
MAKTAEKKSLIEDYHLLSYDTIDSTNAEARRLAGGGASHGAVIWAKRQSAGRGRMGREWISAEGNLYVTVLLNPARPLAECPQLSFVAALAVAETLEAIVPEGRSIACKWPNDVLVDSRKIAGILLESFTHAEAGNGARQWLSVGVGINVDSSPEHVMFPATCLRDAGVELISAKIVLSRFIHNFIHRYDQWAESGFKPIEKEWTKRAYHLGKPVEVVVGDEQHEGILEGIDADGRLLLRHKKSTIGIVAGDVFFKEPV